MIYLSSASTEYLRTTVSGTRAGLPINPTTDPVSFAFLVSPTAVPAATDWVAGSWETVATTYVARVLVGPGTGSAIALTSGTYYAWIRISDTVETPVRAFDTVVVE